MNAEATPQNFHWDASELCRIDGCGKPSRKRGWCIMHYQRWRRRGDPLAETRPYGAPMAEIEWALKYEGDQCILWPYHTGDGYAKIQQGRKSVLVPRLVCERIHGPAPSRKHQAAHSCGHGHLGCISPRHIRWATPKENDADRLLHGTALFGERALDAKLRERDVRLIRSLWPLSTSKRRDFAKACGVDPKTIYRAATGRQWRHL